MIVGIDEVGRGCWAGPLVACAVLSDVDFTPPLDATWKLGDSKKLSKLQRQLADRGIRQTVTGIGIGWVMHDELDSVGLTKAVQLAMQRAVMALPDLKAVEYIVIDGSYNFLKALDEVPPVKTIVKADATIAAVSAASIVAKVARDTWMQTAALQYPGYGFERHVGYGTKQHQTALQTLGLTPLHRRSFKPIARLDVLD